MPCRAGRAEALNKSYVRDVLFWVHKQVEIVIAWD